MAIGELKLQFFDLLAHIHSDSMLFLEFMQNMYSRFQVEDFPTTQPPLEYHFYRGRDNPWGEPTLALVGETWHGNQVLELAGYVYDGILNSVLSHVRNHLLIHAGVVARRGKATIISADSGGGKTTLVLGLVQRGYSFLSDELAPLPRQGGWVDPFPRCLRLRPGYHHLVGLPEPAMDAPIWFEKYLLDIDQLKPGSLGSRAEIERVVIINEGEQKTTESNQSGKELGVFVNRLDDDLIKSVSEIPGVTEVWQTTELGYPVLRFRAENRMRVLSLVEQHFQERSILILDVSKRSLSPPSFIGPAQLVEIPKSQAVMELIRQFQPGHKSKLVTEVYQGQASRLFLELADVLGDARCYQLIPGPLKEMADLIYPLDA